MQPLHPLLHHPLLLRPASFPLAFPLGAHAEPPALRPLRLPLCILCNDELADHLPPIIQPDFQALLTPLSAFAIGVGSAKGRFGHVDGVTRPAESGFSRGGGGSEEDLADVGHEACFVAYGL